MAAAPPSKGIPIVLDLQTTRLEGWLSARAVMMLNSTRKYEGFNPLGKEWSLRCVSIVNDTGARSADYDGFDEKRVIVTGFVIRYDDLPVGNTVVDQAFVRRYYKGQVVHDACNRELVFVAKKIELAD